MTLALWVVLAVSSTVRSLMAAPAAPPESAPSRGVVPSPPGGLTSPASSPGGPAPSPGGLMPAEAVLADVRERMADDLDAPGALAAIDRWAEQIIATSDLPPAPRSAAMLVRDTADALLGVVI